MTFYDNLDNQLIIFVTRLILSTLIYKIYRSIFKESDIF